MELSPWELLALERQPSGTLRARIKHEDGSIEGTAINNLLAIQGVFCTDFIGNKFGAYVMVPTSFWKQIKKELGEYHGRDWRLLAKNRFGGYLGVLSKTTIYVDNIDFILIKPDIGDLVFEFEVGDTHAIHFNKEKLVEKFGYERVGYDVRQPFVPWWTDAYAPIPVLLEWVDYDGFKPAAALLANPPQAALDQWYRQGLIGAPEKTAVTAYIEGRPYYPALPPGTVDGEVVSAESD